MSDVITYEAAFMELNEIVVDIESGEIAVDDLSAKVKRAAELIKVCREKLTSTEADIDQILKDLALSQSDSQSTPPSP